MSWIYISPHCDDIALSCGGLVWEQAQAGREVEVWTICAGDPPPGPLSPFAATLHGRWKLGREAAALRRAEDLQSCARLCAAPRHFPLPDCIYRRTPDGEPLYPTEESLFGQLHPFELGQIDSLTAVLAEALPAEADVVAPLAIGEHVDHQLTRRAVERLGRRPWYYADYPYSQSNAGVLEKLAASGWRARSFPISAAGQLAWEEAVAAHASQISTFWPDPERMRAALQSYASEMGGVRLWQPPD